MCQEQSRHSFGVLTLLSLQELLVEVYKVEKIFSNISHKLPNLPKKKLVQSSEINSKFVKMSEGFEIEIEIKICSHSSYSS